MKTLQSSSRGRGIGSSHRGRGGGGGRGVSRGRGRGRGGAGDARFASRFSDPRFQLSNRANKNKQQHRGPRDVVAEAALSDPRFSKHLPRKEAQLTRQRESDEEEEQEEIESGSDAEEVEELGVDSDDADALDEDVNAWAREEDVELIEARHRVAIVNCDWGHIRAVDLYALLFHALPLGGQLKDVSVYMSDFGRKMIEHERVHGPDLWAKPDEEPGDMEGDDEASNQQQIVEELPDDISEDEASEPRSDGWQDDDPTMLDGEEGEDGELFSSGKYRKYEMDRMKYYYAVATFDSADTAAAVYNELDGMDIEASGVVLDLRYIDDDEVFENPMSCADRIPPNFKPLSSFKAAALSQSRFRISWDQDDAFRHHSMQDSFTGTTAEDDLAAYLAPPDSDDEDEEGKGNTAEEKLCIRRKYAALLAEIGGVPDEMGDDDDDVTGDAGQSSDNSESDDDSLNRFSDVEVEDEEEEDAEDDMLEGDMEATLDFDAGSKANALQRDARLKQKLKEGNLAAKAELKYKLRRKEMKKSKKEMAMQERAEKEAAKEERRDDEKRKLKELLGTDDDGAVRRSGKERRKAHAREVKERMAEQRIAHKQMHMASKLGVTREAQASRVEKEAEAAAEQIDSRFKAKLLSDPRFHLEVAQRDKKVSEDIAGLASTIAKARRVKRGVESSQSAGAPRSNRGGNTEDAAVDFFLNEPVAKKRRNA